MPELEVVAVDEKPLKDISDGDKGAAVTLGREEWYAIPGGVEHRMVMVTVNRFNLGETVNIIASLEAKLAVQKAALAKHTELNE